MAKTNQTVPPTSVAEVTSQDLRLILNIIEIGSSRGVYKGSELTTIGYVFDKITQIINQHEGK